MVEISSHRAIASSVKFSNSVQVSVCSSNPANKNLSSRGFAIPVFGGRLKKIFHARWISFGTYDDGRHFFVIADRFSLS